MNVLNAQDLKYHIMQDGRKLLWMTRSTTLYLCKIEVMALFVNIWMIFHNILYSIKQGEKKSEHSCDFDRILWGNLWTNKTFSLAPIVEQERTCCCHWFGHIIRSTRLVIEDNIACIRDTRIRKHKKCVHSGNQSRSRLPGTNLCTNATADTWSL